MLARLVATLDQVSQGRSGWNMVTGSSDLAARNYGRDGLPPHAERYERADEFARAMFQLWDSWAPDAVVEDRAAGVYVDHAKVRTVDFEGKFFKTRGPLNVPRSPQDRPVTVQAGGSPAGRNFASKWADTIIGYVKTPEEMREYREYVRAKAVLRHDHRRPGACAAAAWSRPARVRPRNVPREPVRILKGRSQDDRAESSAMRSATEGNRHRR